MDLIAPSAFMVLMAILAAIAGYALARKTRHPQLLIGFPLFGALLAERLLTDRLFLTQYLPHTSADIIWSNFTPILLAAASGIAVTIPSPQKWRQRMIVTSLALLAAAALLSPIARPLLRPVVHDSQPSWKDGVCLQSSASTCGSAAAATLLRYHDVWATEKSMESWCLNSRDGSPALGVYRAIHNVGGWLGYQPRVVCGSFEKFVSARQFPALVLVRHEVKQHHWSSVLSNTLQRRRGYGHAVVVFGADERGQFDIGDPASGRRRINGKDLEQLWAGEAIVLERSAQI